MFLLFVLYQLISHHLTRFNWRSVVRQTAFRCCCSSLICTRCMLNQRKIHIFLKRKMLVSCTPSHPYTWKRNSWKDSKTLSIADRWIAGVYTLQLFTDMNSRKCMENWVRTFLAFTCAKRSRRMSESDAFTPTETKIPEHPVASG